MLCPLKQALPGPFPGPFIAESSATRIRTVALHRTQKLWRSGDPRGDHYLTRDLHAPRKGVRRPTFSPRMDSERAG